LKLTLIDEARDFAESYEVLHVTKEKEGLLLATPHYTVFIDSFDDLAEAVMELVGAPSLPEPKGKEVSSVEELLELMRHAGA
jgi:hypothetical protein